MVRKHRFLSGRQTFPELGVCSLHVRLQQGHTVTHWAFNCGQWVKVHNNPARCTGFTVETTAATRAICIWVNSAYIGRERTSLAIPSEIGKSPERYPKSA